MSPKKIITIAAVIMILLLSGYLIYSELTREVPPLAPAEPITEHQKDPEVVARLEAFVIPDEPDAVIKLFRFSNNKITLVDKDSMALYFHIADSEKTSNCSGACADEYPPLTIGSENGLIVGSGIEEGTVSLFRRGSSFQITYKNRPLYRFKGDERPADLNGFLEGWEIASPY